MPVRLRAADSPHVANPRSGERREDILRGARELVAQVGFHDAQMAAIAERAGVALGTLYRYFPSKVALMIEVVARVAQREIDVVASVASGKGRPIDRLAASVWSFASRAVRGRKMAHALLSETVEPEIESARRKYLPKLAREFETVIEQGIREHEFPPQDVRAAGACIVGSLREGLVGTVALESRATTEQRLEQAIAIVSFCVKGVSGDQYVFAPPEGTSAVPTIRRTAQAASARSRSI